MNLLLRHKYFPFLLIGFACLLRLIWVLLIEVAPTSDALWYHEAAIGIAEKGSYELEGKATAFFPIGYPAFLAGLYAVFGQNIIIAQLANVVLSFFILYLTYRLAQAWFSERIALISLAILSFYPNYIAYCSLLLSEMLFTASMLAGLYFWESLSQKGKSFWIGLFWGIASHVKPWLILFPALLKLSFWKKFSWKKLIHIYLVIFLLAFAWAYRNAQVMGDWVPFSTNGGINLLIGNHPEATGTYAYEGLVDSMLSPDAQEVVRDAEARKLAFSYIYRQPWTSLKRVGTKWYYLFRHPETMVFIG